MGKTISISLSDHEAELLEQAAIRWHLYDFNRRPNIEECAAVMIHERLELIRKKIAEEEDRGRR